MTTLYKIDRIVGTKDKTVHASATRIAAIKAAMADERNAGVLGIVLGDLRRIGIDDIFAACDLHKLDEALEKHKFLPYRRTALKGMLARLRVLD
jgi:hypothetical protein